MHPESGAPNGRQAVLRLMRSKVRAYSHQGHGPRAEQQAGYISATSDSTPSVAKGSRSIHCSTGWLLDRFKDAADDNRFGRTGRMAILRRDGVDWRSIRGGTAPSSG